MRVNPEDKKYKDALTSVLLGYSVCPVFGGKAFLKHFGYIDSIETDYQYNLAFENAKKRGILTEEEKLDNLFKNKVWSKEKEDGIKSATAALLNLKKRKSKLSIPSQIKQLLVQIDSSQDSLNKLIIQRQRLLGVTVETIANKRAEDFYIYNSFFKDKDFKIQLIEDSFDVIDSDIMDELKVHYYVALQFILNNEIKKIALRKECLDLMSITDNHYEILGKPYAQYTFFQMDLINVGRFYKHILSCDPKPSEAICKDPEKLEEWWETTQNAKRLLKGQDKDSIGGASMIMGATEQDVKEVYGETPNVVNIGSEIKKAAKDKGGVIDIHDIMKMHGVKK